MDSHTHLGDAGARGVALAVVFLSALLLLDSTPAHAGWGTFADDEQHTAVSTVAAQPLVSIRWSTPVDLAVPSGDILIHYGSPLVTSANTVIVPVKTTNTGNYRVEARSGTNGT